MTIFIKYSYFSIKNKFFGQKYTQIQSTLLMCYQWATKYPQKKYYMKYKSFILLSFFNSYRNRYHFVILQIHRSRIVVVTVDHIGQHEPRSSKMQNRMPGHSTCILCVLIYIFCFDHPIIQVLDPKATLSPILNSVAPRLIWPDSRFFFVQ